MGDPAATVPSRDPMDTPVAPPFPSSAAAGEGGPSTEAPAPAPASYGDYSARLQALQANGAAASAVRRLREEFAGAYPLAPTQWMAWIAEEMARSDGRDYARGLCARAADDYLNVGVWGLWAHLETERGWGGLMRVLEEAVARGAALHFCEGARVWRAVRAGLQKWGRAQEAQEALRRQMRVPLRGNAEEEADGAEGVEDREAVRRLEEVCEGFEKKIVWARKGVDPADESGRRDEDLVFAYGNYAWYLEKDAQRPDVAMAIHERCVAEAFLDPRVWKRYLDFTHRNRMLASQLVRRALRNVPRVEELWPIYVRALAKEDSKGAHILEVLTTAPVKSIELAFSGLQWCRQRMNDDLRKGVVEAITDKFFQEGTWEWAEVNSLWAQMTTNRGLMEQVIAARSSEVRWWLYYADMLNADESEVRALFSRAMKSISLKHVHLVEEKWRRWEALHGTIEDYENVGRAAQSRLPSVWTEDIAEQRPSSKRPREGHRKRARTRKQEKGDSPKLVKNPLSQSQNEDGITDAMDIALPNGHDNTGPPGHPSSDTTRDVHSRTTVKTTEKSKRQREGPHDGEIEIENLDEEQKSAEVETAEVRTETEPCIVFVNNLSFKTSREQVELCFSKFSGFKEVRMPMRVDGASRGIAYVEFEDEQGVNSALEMHEQMLDGRTIWVRRSKPPKHSALQRGGQFGRGGGRGRRKRFPGVRSAHHRQRLVVGDVNDDTTKEKETEAEEEKGRDKNLSQNDFRKMLLG